MSITEYLRKITKEKVENMTVLTDAEKTVYFKK